MIRVCGRILCVSMCVCVCVCVLCQFHWSFQCWQLKLQQTASAVSELVLVCFYRDSVIHLVAVRWAASDVCDR